MKKSKLGIIAAVLLALTITLSACGAAEQQSSEAPAAPAAQMAAAQAPAAPAAPRPASGAEIAKSLRPQQPQAAAPAPAQPAAGADDFNVSGHSVSEKEVIKEVAAEAMSEQPSQVGEFSEERAALVAQNRIIVRTVQLALEVNDVAASIEEISQSVQQDGGWVVSTDRSSRHFGFIAVRVPAAKLDDTLKWMRQVGVDVLSEASTSTDVTDEYYDLRSRVTSLQATEEALIKLLDRAQDVEDALEVQRELARLQVEIEAHLGRIKLLEETAAFSLVNISLNLAPQEMRVDAGEDRTFSVGEVARFRATFYPPEGIDDFDFTWDFGDGSNTVSGNSSAPRADGGRITATVHHQYHSDLESPFIVEVTMNGRGDAGVVEGSDTFIATVTELPAIVVYAGEFRMVDEGDEGTYSGSFTRPEGLRNYQYEWEFGDGSPALTGAVEEGASNVETTHIFENHRPLEYTVTLTISADSDAGKVEGASSFGVYAREVEGFVISGWSAGDNLKGAIRALSGLAQVAGTVAIWVVIFTPVWVVLGLVIYLIARSRRRLRLGRRRRTRAESSVDEGYLSTAQSDDMEERS